MIVIVVKVVSFVRVVTSEMGDFVAMRFVTVEHSVDFGLVREDSASVWVVMVVRCVWVEPVDLVRVCFVRAVKENNVCQSSLVRRQVPASLWTVVLLVQTEMMEQLKAVLYSLQEWVWPG